MRTSPLWSSGRSPRPRLSRACGDAAGSARDLDVVDRHLLIAEPDGIGNKVTKEAFPYPLNRLMTECA